MLSTSGLQDTGVALGGPGAGLVLLVALLACACGAGVSAAAPGERTVVEEWSSVKPPPPPELKAVRVDPKTTALLILDIETRTVDPARRPRAVASVPAIRGLLERARDKGAAVVYSTTGKSSPTDILPEVAPRPGEPSVKASVDKFFGTGLEDLLRERGAKRVIVVGTAAEGAVLNTATGAALRGLEVIVPVDGISSSDLYAEQYVCWHLLNAPGVRGLVTLSTIGQIDFGP